MGSISEGFSNLIDVMMADHGTAVPGVKRPSATHILTTRLLKPLLPTATRCNPGVVLDIKDRQVGPFDIIAGWEAFPPFGEGSGSVYPADGVIFVIQARDWSVSDLTEFGRLAADLKSLERKRKPPIFCTAVSFAPLARDQVADFLKSQSGQSVDGVLALGHHVTLRNSQGWYGDPGRVPFVSESNAADALKAFTFCLLHLTQSFMGLPFGLADYQHL